MSELLMTLAKKQININDKKCHVMHSGIVNLDVQQPIDARQITLLGAHHDYTNPVSYQIHKYAISHAS